MIDYCAVWFANSGLLELSLSGYFHDLHCHSPAVLALLGAS